MIKRLKVCSLLTPAPVTDLEKTDKCFQTLQAQLALKGYQCRQCLDSSFFISSERMTRFCRSIKDLETFVNEVTP